MDLLKAAVVDITTLMATCHALKSPAATEELAIQRKQRTRLRREIKRGTVAYINALARSRGATIEEALLASCRLAAEMHMPRALLSQELLADALAHQPGSLDGMAATRQDLWRLSHIQSHLQSGKVNLQTLTEAPGAKSVDALARQLHRRLRKALIAYVKETLRTKTLKGRLIFKARAAALSAIGPRGAAAAERLAEIESRFQSARHVIARGVTKPLLDLAIDWEHPAAGASGKLGTATVDSFRRQAAPGCTALKEKPADSRR